MNDFFEERLNIVKTNPIIQTLESNSNYLVEESETCLYCGDEIETEFKIETLNNGKIGSFCSKLCSNSVACHISSIITLREMPNLQLLPLFFYKDQKSIKEFIRKSKNINFTFGGHEKIIDKKVISNIKQFYY